MKIIRLFITCAAIAIIGFSRSQSTIQNDIAASDLLSQWNEGTVKASILSFVKTVTDETNPNFLPMQDRVAVFDLDGTILVEKPNFVLFDFIEIYRLPISYDGQPKPAEGGPITRFVQVPLDFISLNCHLTLDYSAMTRDQSIKQLMTIPSIGKSIATDLWNIGIRSADDLKGKDAEVLYDQSNRYAGAVQDRCLLYSFRCAVYYAETEPEDRDPEKLKWWNWKDNRIQ